ncbi:MAG: Gfo/Idh/MocA family oxidoreductase [Pirellulales bacterium]
MPHQTSRRHFLKATAATGVGFWVAGGLRADESKSPNERIRFACIGVGGKGSSDSEDAGRFGDVVAICDIDEQKLDAAAIKFPQAKKYFDFRKLLDEMGDRIDAVTVSTPDHTHAVAAAMAMRMGKHCFCQKPLTHSLFEARTLARIAREKQVATQMGNQGTALSGLRKAAAIVQAGALGTVKEVHVWTNRPVWPQGGERDLEEPAPSYVHWEEWLGPAPYRPHAAGYHPFAWRGWWDFGTGALGDMACHTMNMPFKALDLRDPVSVVAETTGHNKDSYPSKSIIRFEFAASGKRPALSLTWYDGSHLPDKELLNGNDPKASGSIIIGEKGKLYSPDDNGAEYYLLGDVDEPEVDYVQPLDGESAHFAEWVAAIKGGSPAASNFPDYAGPLTETVLLGNLAVWASGKKIEWDAKNLKATNAPEVEPIIKTTYREGYSL